MKYRNTSDDVVNPWHTIQTRNDEYILCHSEIGDAVHRVCKISADGRHIVHSHGGRPGSVQQFLESNLTVSMYNIGSAFHTASLYSCIFHPCYLLPIFANPEFSTLTACSRIFHPCIFVRIAFFTPAFAVAPPLSGALSLGEVVRNVCLECMLNHESDMADRRKCKSHVVLGWVLSVSWWVGMGWVDENKPMRTTLCVPLQFQKQEGHVRMSTL